MSLVSIDSARSCLPLTSCGAVAVSLLFGDVAAAHLRNKRAAFVWPRHCIVLDDLCTKPHQKLTPGVILPSPTPLDTPPLPGCGAESQMTLVPLSVSRTRIDTQRRQGDNYWANSILLLTSHEPPREPRRGLR